MKISDEERKRRSERMKKLHTEGKAGPEYGKLGGRPRKTRVSEIIAQKAQENSEEIWNRLWEAVTQEDSTKLAVETIDKILTYEERERKISVEEEVKYEQLRQNELAELVIGNLFELVRGGQIDIAEIIVDGEFIDDNEGSGETRAIGEGN